MTDKAKIATYEEVLQLLTEHARGGNVTATAALERVLRARGEAFEIDDALDRLLAEGD
jgi:hypothetical protein